MADNFELRRNDYRNNLLDRVEKEIIPKIEKTSLSAGVEEAIEKGLDWYQMREEKKQEIKERQRELDQEKNKWEIDV